MLIRKRKLLDLHTKKPTAQRRNVDTIGFFTLNYLTASLRAFPALNAGTFDAAIVISSPD